MVVKMERHQHQEENAMKKNYIFIYRNIYLSQRTEILKTVHKNRPKQTSIHIYRPIIYYINKPFNLYYKYYNP